MTWSLNAIIRQIYVSVSATISKLQQRSSPLTIFSNVHFLPWTSCTPLLLGTQTWSKYRGTLIIFVCPLLQKKQKYRFTLRWLPSTFKMNCGHASPEVLRGKTMKGAPSGKVVLWASEKSTLWFFPPLEFASLTACRRTVSLVGILVGSRPVQQPV